MADNAEPTVEEMVIDGLVDELKTVPERLATMKGRGYGMAGLTPDEELWSWGFRDESVDVAGLRAQGVGDADIALQAFPLRRRLIEQAGAQYKDQETYANRLASRWLAAQAKGRPLKPPARPPQTLKG